MTKMTKTINGFLNSYELKKLGFTIMIHKGVFDIDVVVFDQEHNYIVLKTYPYSTTKNTLQRATKFVSRLVKKYN